MKKVYTFFFAALITTLGFAQAPQKMSYQAVIRDLSNHLVTTQVGMRISILQGSETGTPSYVETQTPTPNANGLVSIEIGSGTPVTGTFTGIDWSAGPYFIKTETATEAPLTTYTITGTSQLLSVPYALHAKTVASYPETDPVFVAHAASGITSTLIGNWNSAYGWGNHASAGYLTSFTELDPTVTNNFDFSGAATNDLFKFNGTKWVKFTPNYLTSFTELDPIFGVWDKTTGISITASQVSDFTTSVSTNTDVAANTAKVTNATHTGDVTGATDLTLATVNSNLGTFNNITINAKGLATAGSNVSYLTIETDPTVKAITGIVMSNGTTISAAVAGDFPILNQNTTGTAATVTTAAQPAITSVGTLTGLVVSGTTTVIAPVNATDAANKAYVDGLKQQIKTLEDNLIAAGTYKLSDIEGNQYNVVKIGTQVWMAENLKTIKYNDNTAIPLVTDITAWSILTTPGYCWYNNDAATYKATYGALYNWYTVHTGNLCPAGWHAPTDAELTTLENYLIANGYNYDGTTTGNKYAKALASTTLWASSATTGAVGNTDYPAKRNATGFTARPGGYRSDLGYFYSIAYTGYWWSATGSDASNAWCRIFSYGNSDVNRGNGSKKYGFYVRCLRD